MSGDAASFGVEIRGEAPNRGLFVTRPIRAGELILREAPYAWVLQDDQVSVGAVQDGGAGGRLLPVRGVDARARSSTRPRRSKTLPHLSPQRHEQSTLASLPNCEQQLQ